MIGANHFQPMDNFNKLSRKELQALCKGNGIPANKSNAFMMEALTKKRVPLSQMDSNRDQKVDSSIRSPFKSPPVARKSVSNVNSLGPVQKPPVFTNNFLRRGRRKDPPTSNEIEPEKQKVPRTNAASGSGKSSADVLTRSGAPLGKKEAGSSNATKEAKVITSGVTSSNSFTNPSKETTDVLTRSGAPLGKKEAGSSNATKEAKVITSGVTSFNSFTNPSKETTDVLTRSGAPLGKKEAGSSNATKEAKVITSGVTSSNCFTNPSKETTDVLTRSGAPLGKKEAGSSNATKEAKVITSGVTSSNSFTNPSKENIEDRVRSQVDAALCSVQLSKVMKVPERRPSAATSSEFSESAVDSNVKLERGEALNLPLELSEQQRGNGHVEEDMQSECSEQQMDSLSLPDTPANQIRTLQNVSTSTPAVPRSTSLALIAASPPISFSPLVRQVEEKVRSIVDRVHNFWKGREWAVVNNFDLPVQQI